MWLCMWPSFISSSRTKKDSLGSSVYEMLATTEELQTHKQKWDVGGTFLDSVLWYKTAL